MTTEPPAASPPEPLPYLSDRWVDAADAALAGLEPLATEVRVGFQVGNGPDGTSEHQLVLGPDRVGVARGLGGTSVVLRLDYRLAVAIAEGTTSAQRAFLDGQLTLSGDATTLLGHQAALAMVDDRLADLRHRTAF